MDQNFKRKRNFSLEETMCLLDIWSDEDIQKRFAEGVKHSIVWNLIATKMAKAGFCNRDAAEVKNKIANLKKEYYKIKRTWTIGNEPPSWVFWEKLNYILNEKQPNLFNMQNTVNFNENITEINLIGHNEESNLDDSLSGSSVSSFPINPNEFRERQIKTENLPNVVYPKPYARSMSYEKPSSHVNDTMERLLRLEERAMNLLEHRMEIDRQMLTIMSSCMNEITKNKSTCCKCKEEKDSKD